MGAEGHALHTLFAQVGIDLRERQATPGEVAHTRHKPTVLLARLAWQRLERGLGVVHGLKFVVLLHPHHRQASRMAARHWTYCTLPVLPLPTTYTHQSAEPASESKCQPRGRFSVRRIIAASYLT